MSKKRPLFCIRLLRVGYSVERTQMVMGSAFTGSTNGELGNFDRCHTVIQFAVILRRINNVNGH